MCACGDSTDFLEATDKALGACDMSCPGDGGGGGETCGGSSSYDLYAIVPASDGVESPSGGGVGSETTSGDGEAWDMVFTLETGREWGGVGACGVDVSLVIRDGTET